MTAAPSPDKSSQFPPEAARQAIYPMRTQQRPLCVVYAVAPDAFACAALPDAYRALLRDGAGLAVGLPVGAAAVAGGPVGDGGEDAAVAAVSAHSRSLG